MIIFVEGSIRYAMKDSIAVDIGGIGYEVFVANPEEYTIGQSVFLYTHDQIREDARTLYGFDTKEAYELFCALIEVKGIGCRTALNMLSKISVTELIRAVEQGDIRTLKSLPGIGQKSAGQIVLDLKGKVVLPEADLFQPQKVSSKANPVWEEVQGALLALGYKPSVVDELHREFNAIDHMTVDEMLRKALQKLAVQKGV